MELTVTYRKSGDKQVMELDSQCLDDLVVDYAGVPEDERGGTAKQLLAASALHCYCASFAKALEVRGAKFSKITGKATLTTGVNERKQARITGIDIDVTAHMPEEYAPIFERVTKVMRGGCLVTASLEPAIPISYNMRHVCSGECSLDFNCVEHVVHYAAAAHVQ